MGAIAILGAGGRLGAALAREWRAAGEEVVAFDRHSAPLGEPGRVESALEGLDLDAVVNCAALTNVDYCETHEAEAFHINGKAPGELAAFCARRGVRFLHISTDYVFDGLSHQPYGEEDPALPVSVYGASKRAGELAVLAADPAHWVVRVAWVFGPDRPSFVDQVVARALKEDRVDAVADKWATPTYTLDAAGLLQPFIREVSEGGVLHLSNAGSCSWQEYGQWALDCALEAGLPLKARKVGALAMADLKAFVAKRPPFTVLDHAKLARLGGRTPRSWKDAVQEYVQEHLAGALIS